MSEQRPDQLCSRCGGDRGNAGGACCEWCRGTGVEPAPDTPDRREGHTPPVTVAQALEALGKYIEWHGPEHDEEQDCPGDDTCDCSWKPVNDGVNAAYRYLQALTQQAEEIARLRAAVLEWENREAAVCPEDVGFEEVIARLRAEVDACMPYLKDGETPAQCIARNRSDVGIALDLLVAEKRKSEAAESQVQALRQALEEVLGHWYHQRVIDATDDDQKTGCRPCPMAVTPTIADVRRWRAALALPGEAAQET